MGYVFDGANKVISLTSGTTSFSVRDLWSRWVDWWVTSDNAKYLAAFSSLGGDDIDPGAGTKIPIYAFLINGWKIKPQEASHTLFVIDGILLVLGGGDPFIDTVGAYIVRINYQQPVQAISFSSEGGGGGLTQAEHDELMDLKSKVWDEILTGATHNITNSAGRRLREISARVIHTGNAQGAGAGGNQIQLANDASSVDGSYDPSLIAIVDGVGAGQCRLILEYKGSTRMATVDRNWKVAPDVTSEYVIYGDAGREHVNEGLAQGGTLSSITLNALASSFDNAYVGQLVFIRSGKGEDQVRHITAYNGTTKIATVFQDWDDIPDGTSGYVMLAYDAHSKKEIADAIWAHVDARFLLECIRNKKYLEKLGNTWYLVIRNSTDSGDILRKSLKDKDGNDLTDIQIGILAQELATSV